MWLDYVTSRAEGACYPDHLCMLRLGGGKVHAASPAGVGAPPGGMRGVLATMEGGLL